MRGTSRPGTFSEDDLERYREVWGEPGALTAMLNWCRAMFRFGGKPPGSAHVRVPTLMLWELEDRFLGRELAEESVHHGDDVRLELFERVSHRVQREVPQEVTRHLLAFFEDTDGRSPGP